MTAPTRQEIREFILIDGMPPDSRQLLDYDNPLSNVYLEADAEAGALKAHAFDLVEQLRVESLPTAATSATGGLLADWERALAISYPYNTASYTDSYRQARVLSRFREFAVASPENILAAARAIAGLATAVSILEMNRAVLTAANWRDIPPAYLGIAIAPSADTEIQIVAADNAPAGPAGAQFTVRITHPSVEDIYLVIFAPSGASSARYYFGKGSVTAQDFRFYWPGASGLGITGTWRFVITDNGAAGGTIDDPAADGVDGLFVEGVGRAGYGAAEGLGAPIYEWSLVVNEALVNTATYSRASMIELARRWNPAHCNGGVALYQSDGTLCALADDLNAIADLCVAC